MRDSCRKCDIAVDLDHEILHFPDHDPHPRGDDDHDRGLDPARDDVSNCPSQ